MTQLIQRSRSKRHAAALRSSSRLTQTYYRMYRPGQHMVTPEKVIAVLNEAKVEFVLLGTHFVGGWMAEARATDDVDFLVQKGHHRKAVQAVRRAFPKLKVKDQKVVTRFVGPATKTVVIDLIRPLERFFQVVFDNSVPAGRSHRVPDLEMALVCKFAAMVSPHRLGKKKSRDVGDFMDIVGENHEIIDMEKTRRLAALVCTGGAERITFFIDESKAGRIPKV